MYRMFMIVLLLALSSFGTAEAALDGLEDGKTYTRAELEEIARQQMGSGYEEYQAGKASIPELQNQIKTEQQNYKKQQDELNEKVRSGEITDKEYNQQSKELKKSSEDRVDALEKQIKNQEKEVKNFEKEFEQTQKDINKQLEKQQKAAEKAAKAQQKLEDKATKQNDKLQAAVAECQAMNASPAKRQECEEKARKKYGLSDEQQQALDEKNAREQAEKEAAEKAKQQADEEAQKAKQQADDEAYLKSLMDLEEPEEEDPLFSSEANATGSGLTGVCANAGNVFEQIACKAMMFLIDLRVLAYVLSGFGMVMFAWAAIFNKISWKHFSQIAIGLFMLSMIGPFITYFTGDSTVEGNLEYGNYLGGKYNPVLGAGEATCADGSKNCLPDTDIAATVNLPEIEITSSKKNWSIADLKGSIQSGLNLVRSGYNTYQNAKQMATDFKAETQAIGNAIKNSGGGLDGVLNAASQVAGAANRLSYDMQTGMNGIAQQVSNAANAAQDVTATNAEREARQNIRVNGDNNGGNTTNAVSEWLSASGTGGQVLADLDRDLNTVGNAAAGVGKATTAGHEGQKIGGGGSFGDVVGGIFAAGTAIGEGAGVYYDSQEAAAKAEQQRQEMEAMKTSPGLTPAQRAQQQVQNKQQAGGTTVTTNNTSTTSTQPTSGITKEEALKQSEQIIANFAKQQGQSSTATTKNNATQTANANKVATQSASAQKAQSNTEQSSAAQNVATQTAAVGADTISRSNTSTKKDTESTENKTDSSKKTSTSGLGTAGNPYNTLKNPDGSSTTINSDGSVTVTFSDGRKASYAADNEYSKTIREYQSDKCKSDCRDTFMQEDGEAHNACIARC